MTDRNIIQIMVLEIKCRMPDAVRFVPTPQDLERIHLYLAGRQFDLIMLFYGYKFLLGIMELFEETENYEMCAEIKRQIEEHNRKTNDKVPTSLLSK
jgi:hypothetical protein